jgi:hypothetical protein
MKAFQKALLAKSKVMESGDENHRNKAQPTNITQLRSVGYAPCGKHHNATIIPQLLYAFKRFINPYFASLPYRRS